MHSYLKAIGFSRIKTRKETESLIEALISMLHNIDYSIVFEGIETENERDLAYSYGCDVIQGFFYSRPIPSEEFEDKYL